MRSHASVRLSCVLACALVAATTGALAQGRRSGGPPPQAAAAATPTAQLPSDPFAGPVVTKAPYSGDAVTTVTQVLMDGTRVEQKTEARFYRDSTGRIRREQAILGLPGANAAAQPQTVVTIDPTPEDEFAFTLDPTTRTARRGPRSATALAASLNGVVSWLARPDNLTNAAYALTIGDRRAVRIQDGAPPPGGGKQSEESLGTRQMEGVRAVGRKTTTVIPTGQIGNDRPIEITDERWESPDLKLLLYSRYYDPRTGIVEFRLTNVSRAEQPPDLFMVPSDYEIIEPGARGAGGGGRSGGRGGGAGGRGAPQ
jgi:hypothetical protein